jgi:aminopeptidase N
MALYFERHDGQAVTCDDFAQAIADANPDSSLSRLLPQFKHWYSQAGTPRMGAIGHYDADAKRYTLTLAQHCAPTPGQPVKLPFVIPVAYGLMAADGRELATGMHVLTSATETLTFDQIESAPVPSLLRGFSAPVILDTEYSDDQLITLLAHDTDPFNRWEAAQRLALRRAIKFIAEYADPARAGAYWSWIPRSWKPCAACCATLGWTLPSRNWC